MTRHHWFLSPILALTLVGLGSCTPVRDAPPATPAISASAAAGMSELFEVHENGRIYLFTRRAAFDAFVEQGALGPHYAIIGAGPTGETIIAVLAENEAAGAIPPESRALELYAGDAGGAGAFYGELVWLDGRRYVFERLADMRLFRETGEALRTHALIHDGPHGETVVFVLGPQSPGPGARRELLSRFGEYSAKDIPSVGLTREPLPMT